MNRLTLSASLLMLLACLVLPAASHAGDPIYRNPLGEGVGWNPNAKVPVWLFSGSLPQVPEPLIYEEVVKAVVVWNAAPRSSLNLTFEGVLPGPLTPSTFDEAVFEDAFSTTPRREAILIVPDPNGLLLEDVQAGISQRVLGLFWGQTQPSTSYLRLSIVYLNGVLLTPNRLPVTLRHEMGHALGLAHMEANVDCGQLVPPPDEAGCEYRPLMRRGFHGGIHADPTLDDYATLAGLYPSKALGEETGKIEGRLTLRSTASPVEGAVVVARDVNDPRQKAVSSVTSNRYDRRGKFQITGLPPGEYRLEVAPIVSRTGSASDQVGDVYSPFPVLRSPSTFFAQTNGNLTPLSVFRVHVEGGQKLEVNLLQDDVSPDSLPPPSIREAAAVMRGDVIYTQIALDNPNGEPLAIWEKRLNAEGEGLNPGVWLWDQTHSLGVKNPLLHLTMSSKNTGQIHKTRSLQLYVGGTAHYSRLDSALPGVSPDLLTQVPVDIEPDIGDVDGDGGFTLDDVIMALGEAVGIGSLSLKQGMQADLYPLPGKDGRFWGDGQVDITDAVDLLRRLVGLETRDLRHEAAAHPSFSSSEHLPTMNTDLDSSFDIPKTHPRGGILLP